jgi:striatin 1/3/4
MTAHLDAVTGLAIDPHGLYLLSGSHDGSLRFWDFDSKACIQDIPAHRKHYDEAIYDVACHSSKPFFASAGADSIAKVLE